MHLGIAVLLGPLAGADGGGVVAAALGVAGAALDSADIFALHIDLDRVDALGIVGAHRAADDAEQIGVGCVNAQAGVRGDDKGTDIQGSIRLGGHPVGVHLDQGLDTLHKQVLRDLGDAQALTGVVHAAGVVIGTEQLHAAVGSAVGLHTLKHFLGVMEHHAGRLQLQRSVGNDTGVMPTLACLVIEQEHMVGEHLAEFQSLGIGLGFGCGRFRDFDGFHCKRPPMYDHVAHIMYQVILDYSSVTADVQW